nr:putative late blight resistance protein homolog R1B-17 [Ipomoea batatas]
MVPNLKELGIYIEGELLSGCVESLVHLRLLEKLKIEIGRVEQFYLPTAFPSKLKKLTLHSTYLPWHEMGIIGKLPNLEVLKLKDFAFCGPEWNPSGWEFRDLKVLLIAHTNLKRWNANFHHFPVLERLILRYCWDLKKVPIGFAKIRTLKLIELDNCYSSIVTSANQISSAKILSFHRMLNCQTMKAQKKKASMESSPKAILKIFEGGVEGCKKNVTVEFVNYEVSGMSFMGLMAYFLVDLY